MLVRHLKSLALCAFSFALAASLVSAQEAADPLQEQRQTPLQTDSELQKEAQRQQESQLQDKLQQQTEGQPQTADAEEEGRLPKAFEKLNLTEEQKQQIQQKTAQIDKRIEELWRQFHQLHMSTVSMEAAWITSLASSLDDQQRTQFQEARRQDQQNRQRLGFRPQQSDQKADDQIEIKPDQTPGQDSKSETAKPRLQPGAERPQQDEQAHSQKSDDQNVVIYGITIISPGKHIDRSQMTKEQQVECDEMCAAYAAGIKAHWEQLQTLHLQMVQAQSEKIAAIEEILTEEQLQQLKEMQKQPQEESEANPESESPDLKSETDSNSANSDNSDDENETP